MGDSVMSVIDRLKYLFTGELKESAVASIMVQPGQSKKTSPVRYDQYVKESYMKNVIAFRAILEVSMAVASVDWNLFKHDKDGGVDPITDHPVLDVFNRPNPYESFAYFMAKSQVNLTTAGNSFIERVTAGASGARSIKEMYSHRPDRITIKVNETSGLLESYIYTVNNKKKVFEVDPVTQQGDILHVRDVNPLDDWWGMGSTTPQVMELDASNEAILWQKSLVENRGQPGMVLTMETNLTAKQRDNIEEALKTKFTGGANAGKNLVLDNAKNISVKPFGFTPVEMDWLESNREMARRIAFGYGVPPLLIGIPGDNTYNNYKEANLAFWEKTVVFWLNLWRGEFNNWIFDAKDTESGVELDYDLDGVPALAPRRQEMWENANKAMHLTINEKRRLLGYPDIEGGDVVLVQASLLPLGETPEDEEPDDDVDDSDDDNDTDNEKNTLIVDDETAAHVLDAIGNNGDE
jgi:HK97 family phage portal protein